MARAVLHWVVDQATALLPLRVSGAEWAAESLTIWGEGWSFSTMSSWRLSSDGSFACSCFHEPDTASNHLVGNSLERIEVRVGAVVDDITLVFEGVVVEVFSDMAVEPWVMSLGGGTFVPSSIED